MGLQSNLVDSTRKRFWKGFRRQRANPRNPRAEDRPAAKPDEVIQDFRPDQRKQDATRIT